MPPIATRGLCLALAFSLLLSGCAHVSLTYHDEPGDLAAVKLYPFFEAENGDKYLVGGLGVTLYPRWDEPALGDPEDRVIHGITSALEPLVYRGLVPGPYRLRVFLNDDVHVSEKIDLLPGKRLTVRIDVEGVESSARRERNLEKLAGHVGEAFIIVGKVALVVGVKALLIYAGEDDVDLDFGELFGEEEDE